MKKTLGIAVLLALAACGQEQSNNPSAQTSAPNAPPASAVSGFTPPPKPSHYYSLEDEGEYGYERGISEEAAKSGTVTQAMIMVQYLGEKDGVNTIQMKDGLYRIVFSCKTPCEFVKQKVYAEGSLIKTENMRASEGSVIWAVMQDAQNGLLIPYSKRAKKAATPKDDQ